MRCGFGFRVVAAVLVALLIALVAWALPASAASSPKLELQWDRWTSVPGLPPLEGASAAFDSDDGDAVLFGGRTPGGTLSDDTWLWDGRTWQQLPASQTVAPPARELASMAFDPFLHQLILFGGKGADGALLSDTWAWNGYAWYELEGSGPGARESASMAFDASGDLVLFGGFGYPGGQSPSAGNRTASPNDVAPQPQLLADTWTWTSAGWVASRAKGPSSRMGAALAYDQGEKQTVLFGGLTSSPGAQGKNLNDTWAWDGSKWTRVTTRGVVPNTSSPILVSYDPLSAILLLASSGSGTGIMSLWQWSGTSWVHLATTGAPRTRQLPVAVFDAVSSSLLFGGGNNLGGTTLPDYWQLVAILPSEAHPSEGHAAPPPNTRSSSSPPTSVTTSTTGATTISPPPTSPATVAPSAGHATSTAAHRRSGHHLAWWTIAAMVGLAVLIPAVAWLVMSVSGRRRRRAAKEARNGSRSNQPGGP